MKKQRIITAVGTAVMSSLILSAAVYADNSSSDKGVLVENGKSVVLTDKKNAEDPDKLLMDFLGSKLKNDEPLANSNLAELNLSASEKKVFDAISKELKRIAAGQRSDAVIETGLNLSWTYSELGLSSDCTESDIRTAVNKRRSAIYRTLVNDLPYEHYWYDRDAGCVSTSDGLLRNDDAGKITCKNYTVMYSVLDDFALASETYITDTSKTSAASVAADNAANIVLDNIALDDYDKLLAYKNVICDLNVYNKAAAAESDNPGDYSPWHIINVFDGDPATNVVCEGYAKAFLFLCELSEFESDVECYTVLGDLTYKEKTGYHMWNIVNVDGTSYITDVTNCDSGTAGAPDKLFMAGATGSVTDGYYESGSKCMFEYDTKYTKYYTNEILTISPTDYTKPMYTGDFRVIGGTGGTDYVYDSNNGILTVLTDTPLTIKNKKWAGTTDNRIRVAYGTDAQITLDGVVIESDTYGIKVDDNSTGDVMLILAEGSYNKIKAGSFYAGIEKGSSSGSVGRLTICGKGALYVTGGSECAGIGGATFQGYTDTRNITISQQVTVTSVGGAGGAGIGGGYNGKAYNIIITGGSVKAVAGDSANAIGGGRGGSAINPTDGTNKLYPVVIANPKSEAVYIDGIAHTPKNHKAVSSSDTNLYVYLTGENHTVKVGSLKNTYTLSNGVLSAKVSGLKATADENSVKLTWNKVAGASKYRVQQYTTAGWKTVKYVTANSYTVTGLTNGKSYSFRVIPNSGENWGIPSATVKATPVLLAPKTVKATFGNGKIRLSWTAVTGATKYRVQQYTGSGWSSIKYTTTCAHTVTGLTNGKTYSFRVVAYVNGAWKTPSATVKSVPNIPVPQNVTAKTGNKYIKLTWDNISEATKFCVQQYTSSGWKNISYPTTNSIIISNLTNGTYYSFRVLAFVDGQWGKTSETVKAAPVSPVPQNVTVKAGDKYIKLSWTKVQRAEKYRIQQYTTSGWKTVDYTTTNTFTINNLTNGKYYSFRVLSYVDGKWSSASKTVKAAPVNPVPQNLKARGGDKYIRLTWNKVSGAEKYRVQQYTSSGWKTIDYVTTNTCTVKNLTNGKNYLFRVLSYFDGKWSDYSAKVKAAPVNPVPQNVKAAKCGNKYIKLTWNTVTGAEKYRIQQYTASGWKTVDYSTTNSFIVSGLTNGQSYSFRVLSYFDGKWSAASETVKGTPETSIPQNVKAVGGNKAVTLTWNKVTLATKYRIQQYTASGWKTVDYTTTNSYTASGLTNGQSYSFRVLSYTDGKWSTASKTVKCAPVNPVPQKLKATAGNGSVKLSWNVVTGATKYAVQKYASTGWKTVGYATTASYTVTGLTNGTDYLFRVRSDFGGSWSEPSAKVQIAPVDPVPQNVKATAGEKSVKLSWNSVTGATKYRIQQYTASGWSTVDYVTTNSYTVTGLTNGKSYSFRVVAYLNGTWGEASAAVKASPVEPVPQNVMAVAGNGQVKLSWTAVKGAEKYRIQMYTASGWTTKDYATTNTYTVTGLKNNTEYSFRVLSYFGGKWSGASATVMAMPINEVPQNFKAVIGDGQALLSWNKVNGAVKYRIERYTNSAWATVADTASCSYTVSGLSNGASYVFRVSAYVNGDWGNPSEKIKVTLVNPVPQNLTCVVGDQSAKLSWTEVSGAEKYRVQLYTGTEWTTVDYVTTNYCNITGLINGKTYVYRVLSNYGGSWSAPSQKIKTPVITGTPQNLKATPASGSVVLTWSAVNGAEKYRIQQFDGNGWNTVQYSSVNSCTVVGLQGGAEYTFRVVAYSGNEWSEASEQVKSVPRS